MSAVKEERCSVSYPMFGEAEVCRAVSVLFGFVPEVVSLNLLSGI